MTLPKDLQIYCRNRILKRVIPCIILISVFATILTLWGSVIFNTDNKAFQTSCYVVVMLIPFVITGVPHKLIDSTYYGTVKKVDIVTTTDNDSSVKPTREHLYGTNHVVVLPDANDSSVHCSVCGSSNYIADDKCRDCGHSLIKHI